MSAVALMGREATHQPSRSRMRRGEVRRGYYGCALPSESLVQEADRGPLPARRGLPRLAASAMSHASDPTDAKFTEHGWRTPHTRSLPQQLALLRRAVRTRTSHGAAPDSPPWESITGFALYTLIAVGLSVLVLGWIEEPARRAIREGRLPRLPRRVAPDTPEPVTAPQEV